MTSYPPPPPYPGGPDDFLPGTADPARDGIARADKTDPDTGYTRPPNYVPPAFTDPHFGSFYPQASAPPPPPPSVNVISVNQRMHHEVRVTPQATAPHAAASPTPVRARCPHCGETVVTRTTAYAGNHAWKMAAIMFFCVCWLCAWLPLVLEQCHDVRHDCPRCGKAVATYERR